jgi:hypothetical protein
VGAAVQVAAVLERERQVAVAVLERGLQVVAAVLERELAVPERELAAKT